MADREDLGRLVRETWVKWASEQPAPKPSWLVPWEELDEGQREVDCRIGEAVAAAAFPRCPTPCDDDCEQPCHEVHDIPSHRDHNPEVCVAAIVAAAAAAERERCIDEVNNQGFSAAAVLLAQSLLPTVGQVHAWLTAHGWHKNPSGSAGALWDNGPHQIGVPDIDSDPRYTLGAIQRVALAEDRPFGAILAEMLREAP